MLIGKRSAKIVADIFIGDVFASDDGCKKDVLFSCWSGSYRAEGKCVSLKPNGKKRRTLLVKNIAGLEVRILAQGKEPPE